MPTNATGLDIEKQIQEVAAMFPGGKQEEPAPQVQADPVSPVPVLGNIADKQELHEATKEIPDEDFAHLVARSFRVNNALRGMFDHVVRQAQYEPDPDFKLAEHYEDLTKGVPSLFHDKFKKANSLEEAYDIKRGIASDLEDMAVLGDHGVTGVLATFAGGVIDADAIIPFLGKAASIARSAKAIEAAKAAEAIRRGGRLSLSSRIATTLEVQGKPMAAATVGRFGGLVDDVASGAKAALVTESILAEVGDTNSWSDVPAAMLMAGGFGGAIRMLRGFPAGLSIKEVGSGKVNPDGSVVPVSNAAEEFIENAADPHLTRHIDDELDDNLNEYSGASVFADSIFGNNITERAAHLIGRIEPALAFADGWRKKFRDMLAKGPFADDFTRLWESGSVTAKALAVSLFESAEGFVINGKSGAILAEHFMHSGYKMFAEGHDTVLARMFEARGLTWMDWREKADLTADLYRRTIQTANEIRLGRQTNIDQDVAEMLVFVDINSKFVLSEAKGGGAGARSVPGFETLAEQKAHIPLIWSGEAIQQAIIKLGKGDVGKAKLQEAIAQAYLDALPDIEPDMAQVLAGALINRQISKSAGLDMDVGYLLSTDGKDFMVESLVLNGMDEADALAFMDRLTNKEKDAGKIAYARRRTNIDLSGEYNGVKMIDLVEQDLNKIMFQYNDSMSKRIALSRHGLDSKSKIEAVKNTIKKEIREAREAEGKVQSNEEVRAMEEFLNYAFEYFEPGSVNKHINPWVRRAKDATNLSLLGKLGLTQIAETAGIIANSGIKNFVAASELMQSLWKNADGGMNRAQVADDLGWCVGNLGYENGLLRSDALQDAALDAATTSGGLTRHIDEWMRKGQHLQGFLSGYTKVLSGQLQLGALSITNKIFRGLRSAEDMTAMLKTAGFTKSTVTQLRKLVDNGTIEFNAAGHVDKLNVDKWSPELREDFGRSMLRMSFQMTQRALPGESMKWLHAPSTALFGHLQSFALLAMRKQFLRTAGRNDDSAKLLIAYGMGTAAIATVVKATIEGQELETADVLKRSFALNNSLSWAATGIDLAATVMGLEDLAPGGRYAGDISLPVLGVAKDALHLPGAIASMLPGVEFDRQDKRALHVLPVVGRMYGTGMLFDGMVTE